MEKHVKQFSARFAETNPVAYPANKFQAFLGYRSHQCLAFRRYHHLSFVFSGPVKDPQIRTDFIATHYANNCKTHLKALGGLSLTFHIYPHFTAIKPIQKTFPNFTAINFLFTKPPYFAPVISNKS
jgi:hypothetical protein